LFLVSLFAAGVSAQTTVTIGVQGTANSWPFNYTAGNGRYQTLYSASEMTTAGTITEIRVYGSNVTPPTFTNLRLRLAHSTLQPLTITGTFDTNYTGTLTTVLGPSNYTPSKTGTNYSNFPLTTPFAYNGTQSLLVDWSYDARSAAGWTIDSASTARNRVYLNGGSYTSASGTASASGNWQIQFLITTGPGLAVTATPGTTQNVYANATGTGGNGISAGTFTIAANNQGAATLNSISIQASGTGADNTAYTEVALYEDTNSSSAFEFGTDTLYGSAATAFPADNGTITFTATQNFNASQTRRYFVVVKLNGSPLATTGQTFNFAVQDIAVTTPATKGGVPSATMNGLTILAATLTFADNTSATQVTAYPSSGDYVLQDFTVSYSAGPDTTLATLTLSSQGSGNDSTGYASVKLYFDSNSDGSYTVGTDAEIATAAAFAADNGNCVLTLTGSNTFTAGGASRRYFVVVAYNATPTANQVFQTRITAVSGSYTSTTGNLPQPAAGFTAGAVIGQLSFVFADMSPASQGTAYVGGTDFLIQSFTINYPNGPANTIGQITVTASGTGHDANDYASVGLYRDQNANGSYDTGVDVQVDSQTAFGADNGTLNFTLTGIEAQFTTGQTKRYFIVVGFNLNGTNNTTFATQITGGSNMGMGATASGIPAPSGGATPGLNLLANNLNFTLNGPLAATTINSNSQGAGGGGLLLCDISVQAVNAAWTCTSITFTASGSGDDSTAFSYLALHEDSNANGTFDGTSADVLAVAAAATAFGFDDGTYVASLSNTAFPAQTTRRFFLVVRMAGTAVSGQTFNARVQSATGTPPSGGQVTGTPTSNTTSFIIDQAALTAANGPAAPNSALREAGTAFGYTLGQFRLSATNQNITVTGLNLTTAGSGDFANDLDASTGVELYLDNGNGVYDGAPTDTLLRSGAGNNGVIVCNFASSITVNNNTNADIWVRLAVLASAGAATPETFRLSIAATTDVAVVGGVTVLLGTPAPDTNTLGVVIYNVSNFTPTSGPQSGGQPITITGSGFSLPFTCTIGGTLCTGSAVITGGGTQVTGLNVPAGAGSNLAIVLNSGTLPPKTLTQTYSYFGGSVVGGGGGGGTGGGGGGCQAQSATQGALWALLSAIALLALAARLTRRRA
jgi:hypothetical protein